jgi:hypothetical protein
MSKKKNINKQRLSTFPPTQSHPFPPKQISLDLSELEPELELGV